MVFLFVLDDSLILNASLRCGGVRLNYTSGLALYHGVQAGLYPQLSITAPDRVT